ncbi:hypothetical protein CAOG_00984 [Capsaspora owczarzaki ATCC 30864]|uniref:MRPL25 domain-containing protein n=1 Tax=Capsaspora owczarzaki (strain ATCC 30864) TaxID=595528 RepID=A0A0D2WI84_CAPO3|nr:hypothetical protein CAOG_00984 [Capsaspora owczarzaki ATCC 30864]KJE89535.1 hypothetical protein CAOG_000984 [Capsaspora owczarzaki ATCC 30864]|eukprot:XP_004365855.1 hypothetical protein CAOG_00984 [Capsaspora owczarzaki ATCC 30864]
MVAPTLSRTLLMMGFQAATMPVFRNGAWRPPMLSKREVAQSLKLFGPGIVPAPKVSNWQPTHAKGHLYDIQKGTRQAKVDKIMETMQAQKDALRQERRNYRITVRADSKPVASDTYTEADQLASKLKRERLMAKKEAKKEKKAR